MLPKKRLLDDFSNDVKLEELCRSHKKLVPAVRDFPPGCGINEEDEREAPKMYSDVGRMVESPPDEVNIFISYKPQEMERSRSFVSRPAGGKVKRWEPPCTKGGYNHKPKVTTTIGMRRKNLENGDVNGSKMSWNREDKLTSSKCYEDVKLKSFEPDESCRNKGYDASRSIAREDKMTNSKLDEIVKLKSFEPDDSGRNKAYDASRPISRQDKVTNSKPDEDVRLKSFEPHESGRNKAYDASRSIDREDGENGKLKSFEPNELGRNEACFASRTIDDDDKLTNSRPYENGKLKSYDPNESGRYDAYHALGLTNGEEKLTISKRDGNGKLKSFEPNESGRNEAYCASRSIDGDDKLTNFKPVVPMDNSKLKSFASMEPGIRKTYIAPKSTRVKQWDPRSEAPELELTSDILSEKDQLRREKIKEAMSVFEQVHEQLLEENKLKPYGKKIDPSRVPFEAAKIVRQKLKWMDPNKTLGSVCGIQIGDKFRYRSQLMMFGLHCQPHSGIDFIKKGEKNLAISIVDSHRYSNESGSSDTLVYSGHGGCCVYGMKLPREEQKDQELVRGNLAMKNSMDRKIAVRVIKKVQVYGKEFFVYDGLYNVDRYAEETNAEGKIVFKFHLNRVSGQPPLKKMLKW